MREGMRVWRVVREGGGGRGKVEEGGRGERIRRRGKGNSDRVEKGLARGR